MGKEIRINRQKDLVHTPCLEFGVIGRLRFGVVDLEFGVVALEFGVVGLLEKDPERKSGNR